MKRIGILFATVTLIVSGLFAGVEAKPPDFCISKPTHPSCATPIPTRTPTPVPTATPTIVPTPTSTATPTIIPTPTAPPASSLADCPNGTVGTESQAWWTTTPGKTGTNFGHLHVGACMPFKQQVSGILSLNIRLIMHENPGIFDYLNPVLKTDNQELSLPHNISLQGWKCVGTCERWVTLTVDTTLSSYDGVQEIRIRTYVKEPDGNIMHASVNTLVNLVNGKTINPIDRKPYQRAKGWYTGSGYCEADSLTDLPTAPISNWTPSIQGVWHGAADDLRVSRYRAALDADNHAGIPGTTLKEGVGELAPTQVSLGGLSSGSHRLSLRVDCDDPRGSTNSGIMVIFFKVP